jgi:dUTP pyrophosphatase
VFKKISYEQWQKDAEKYTNMSPEEIKHSYNLIKIPTRGSEYSAGYDFYLPYDFTLESGQSIILTGIRWDCIGEEDTAINRALFLFARSSTAKKYGFALMNKVGVVDMDYYKADNEGHIMLLVDAKSATSEYTLNQGDKIAQGVILPYYVEAGTELVGKERTGGFGSTGK